MKKIILISGFFVLIAAAAMRAEIITDDVGRKVEVNTPVDSIVCLSPANTEMIFWMGLQDKLVAVSNSCDYPAAAKGMEKAGDFMNPDVEKIVKLNPGVVISGGGVQKKAIAKLESLGIPVVVLYPLNVERAIWKDISIIGRLAGETVKAQKKIIEYERLMDEVAAPSETPLKVYLEMWGQPVMAVGKSSFINQELKLAGGRNILADSGTEYPKVSPEEIIKRDPDVIILLYKPEKDFMNRPYFRQTTAGKKGSIYLLGDIDSVLRPGPRLPQGIKSLKHLINKAAVK